MFMFAAAVAAGYALYTSRGITLAYDAADATLSHAETAAQQKITLPHTTTPLYLADLAMLTDKGLWLYVAKGHPLPASYVPPTLQRLTLPFSSADSQPMLQQRVADQLTELFAEADREGHHLIISSAYRSISDQQKMYDDFVAKKGESLASQYVATPGSSEHHTGLAVDVNDDTSACRADSEKCSLSWTSAAWLADTAPTYGFIIRYPSGAQPITGIAYEPWHLRYVGVSLAKLLTTSELTYDEFIGQVAPGRVKQ